jgi:hypothetical protein
MEVNMSGKVKIVVLSVLAALFLLPSLVQTGGARVVYLKATFRDSPGDPVNGILPDRIASDNKGAYQNASNVTVQFSEIGELQFIIAERATRRVNFLFNSFNWLGQGPCAACTQVAGETWPEAGRYSGRKAPDLFRNQHTRYVPPEILQ